eukprot:gene16219-biopygen4156
MAIEQTEPSPQSPASSQPPTLAHLATPLDALSAAQQRSLAILERARGQSPRGALVKAGSKAMEPVEQGHDADEGMHER